MNSFRKHFIIIFMILIPAVFIACTKEEDELAIEHRQFYEELKDWYFWYDQIPDIDPTSYPSLAHIMEAIRYRPLDRWSFVTEYDEYIAYIQNSEFVGYGFGSRFDADGNLRVSFVFNTVPMWGAGVRRGWIIKAINNVNITPESNWSSLLGPAERGVSNTFTYLKPDGEEVKLTFEKQVVTMNTVLHYDVLQAGSAKVGYMVLQGFTGTTDKELETVFNLFKQEQVTELILDMRYNGGGLTSVAKKISSMIGGKDLAGKPFTKYVYNSKKSNNNRTELFTNEANSLEINRLITIATRSTASSSELVINGLRPYMNVHIVGDNTYGKPMGANIFRFNTKWAMVPITFKTVNANNQGEYFEGLPADIMAADGIAFPFGDPNEPSLKAALSFIQTGVAKSAPAAVRIPYNDAFDDQWSLRRMIGAY
jgi:carboxyl-terminal processing protease